MCARAVFAAAAKLMGEGEAEKVMAQLPRHVSDLWPQPIVV
jgi:uncharacterized protein (DUF2267 family)